MNTKYTATPLIAGNLEVMIGTENRFSGIPTVYEELRKAGLPDPLFKSTRGRFSVTFLKNNINDINISNEYNDIRKKIKDFYKNPHSKEEISEMLNIKTSYYVMSKFLVPLIKEGTIGLTIPDKPQSKYQKYYTVK